jgi:hypothetical protein
VNVRGALNPAVPRRSRRFEVLDVVGSLVVRAEVRVVDLSVAGMAVETTQPMTAGQLCVVAVARDGQRLDLSGRVVWCELDPDRGGGEGLDRVFRAGLRFEEVHGAQTVAIQRLIETSAAFDPGVPLPGRFVAFDGQTEGDGEGASFEVKRLSLSGMLVETGRALGRGEVVAFEARLDDALFGGRGLVARVEPSEVIGERSRFLVGLEFQTLSRRSQDILDHHVARLVAQWRRVSVA